MERSVLRMKDTVYINNVDEPICLTWATSWEAINEASPLTVNTTDGSCRVLNYLFTVVVSLSLKAVAACGIRKARVLKTIFQVF